MRPNEYLVRSERTVLRFCHWFKIEIFENLILNQNEDDSPAANIYKKGKTLAISQNYIKKHIKIYLTLINENKSIRKTKLFSD